MAQRRRKGGDDDEWDDMESPCIGLGHVSVLDTNEIAEPYNKNAIGFVHFGTSTPLKPRRKRSLSKRRRRRKAG
jgi:hypothetical protein